MKKKDYKINYPNPVEEGLMMHLDAARARGMRGGTGSNSPTIIWKDCSGNQRDGVLKHFGEVKPAWQADRLTFSGSSGGDDFVELAADGSQNFDNQEFTIEVWASVELGGNKPLFAYDGPVDIKPCAHLRTSATGCTFTFNIGGDFKSISAPLPDNFEATQLNQFVCTFKSGCQELYVNNVLVASGTYSGKIEYFPTPVYLGKSAAINAKLIGEIGNVLYYKRALTIQEIKQNYSAFGGKMVLPTEYVNVTDYGAKGDAQTDDTAAIQRALDAAADYELKDGQKVSKAAVGGGNVYLPPGVYMINSLKAVEMRSNTNIYMHGRAVLKAIPNDSLFYTVLAVRQVENVGIYGGTVCGDRDEHTGTQGQWGMGISIINAHNVRVEGTRADQCWGDGFYIGTDTFYAATVVPEPYTAPEDIYLIDVKADRNRRQGISLISGRRVDIIRPLLINTGGFGDPEAGLDIEPDNCTHILEDIYVEDAVTKNNGGAGILIYLNNLLKRTTTPANKNISIVINGHHDIGSQLGCDIRDRGVSLDVDGVKSIVTGNLSIYDGVWEQSKTQALRIWDHLAHLSKNGDPQVYAIEVHDPVFKNLSSSNSSLAIKNQFINGIIGNVIIKRPFFYDDTGKDEVIPYAISNYDSTKNIKICSPKYDENYKKMSQPWYDLFICNCEQCN